MGLLEIWLVATLTISTGKSERKSGNVLQSTINVLKIALWWRCYAVPSCIDVNPELYSGKEKNKGL